jgi:hypothetical protein
MSINGTKESLVLPCRENVKIFKNANTAHKGKLLLPLFKTSCEAK